MTKKQIITQLPYSAPFLFVDELLEVSENGSSGCYTFKKDEFFYKGHFKNNPVTPGVILTEVMAQIGVVCLGIFLNKSENVTKEPTSIALTSSEINFYLPVYPEETITVVSEKVYYRFNKLKCNVRLLNQKKEVVCKGIISGMLAHGK